VDVGTVSRFAERLHHAGGGRQVGTAHCEFDDPPPRGGFYLGDFAQAARKVIFADSVEPLRPLDPHSVVFHDLILTDCCMPRNTPNFVPERTKISDSFFCRLRGHTTGCGRRQAGRGNEKLSRFVRKWIE
jgi:hypothetical protein